MPSLDTPTGPCFPKKQCDSVKQRNTQMDESPVKSISSDEMSKAQFPESTMKQLMMSFPQSEQNTFVESV